MKKDYTELRAKSRFLKTIGITLEVYDWIELKRGRKSRAAFLDDFIQENRNPNLFKNGTSKANRKKI